MKLRFFVKLALVVTASTWMAFSASSPLNAQTVGWCASSPGAVFRVGYGPGGFYYSNGNADNWAWHDGGTNTDADCYNNALLSVVYCGASCASPGLTAGEVCALDSRIRWVDSGIDHVYWNPDGRDAYLMNGGTLLGSPSGTAACCTDFGVNC
jgi:hypothetical protein